jgi:hypothetical protein
MDFKRRRAKALTWAINAVALSPLPIPKDIADDLAELLADWKQEAKRLRQPEYRGPAITLEGFKLSQLRGRQVVLDRDLKTIGGDCFPAGTVMVIRSSHAGRMSLTPAKGPGWIRGVERWGMRLLPIDQQVPTKNEP